MARPGSVFAVLATALAVIAGCGGDDGDEPRAGRAGDGGATTVWAVGDGGVAGPEDDRVGRFLAEQDVDKLLYLGDVYETGTEEEFQRHFESAFGRFGKVTEPTPGNHDWPNHGQGYDRYWAVKLERDEGRHYYSFDLAGWHFVSLNSEERIGRRSKQLAWLRGDLARRSDCTIAFVHRPRFSAGLHEDDERLEPLWSALEGRAVAVLSGHDHNYQRFEADRGIVQFVVGTGGRRRYAVDTRDERVAGSSDDTFGALRLRPREGAFDYAYLSVEGKELDKGSLRCRSGR